MRKILFPTFFISALFLVSCRQGSEGETVNVYTHRHYDVDKGLFNQFHEETGIKVNVINASADELIQRMETEGENSPADLLVTVDAGRLNLAQQKGLLQPVTSEYLTAIVPAQYRQPEGYWYGITVRARIIAYSKERVNPGEISNYEDLADPKWKGRILVRSSDNVYNQSLLASMIAANGEESSVNWAKGVVANLARAPKGSDRDQVKAIAGGEGDLTLVNTYYIGQLLTSNNEEERKAGEAVAILFPNQGNRGTHVNVSGVGVAKYAKNRENAIKLAEFLVGEAAQKKLAEANYEYPVNPAVKAAELPEQWGSFRKDSINLSLLGAYNELAVKTFDLAGWN